MPIIESPVPTRVIYTAGAPTNGTSAIQTLTIGGTPTGGTFRLKYEGATTAQIPWNATNATLIASIDAALEALSTVGTGNLTTAAGTVTAGIGTITITFAGGLANRAVSAITVVDNSMTGTAPTVAVAITTPGVDASGLNAPKGQLLTDTTNAILYQNTGTQSSPVWSKVGLET
jgi:hypothetical protein